MYFLYCHWNFAVHHNFHVMLDRVDANACMGFHNSGAHEWFSFHSEMIGATVLCSSAFFLVILLENIIKPGYLQITLVQLVTVNFLYIEIPFAARQKEKFKPRYQFQLCWQVFCCFHWRACESVFDIWAGFEYNPLCYGLSCLPSRELDGICRVNWTVFRHSNRGTTCGAKLSALPQLAHFWHCWILQFGGTVFLEKFQMVGSFWEQHLLLFGSRCGVVSSIFFLIRLFNSDGFLPHFHHAALILHLHNWADHNF